MGGTATALAPAPTVAFAGGGLLPVDAESDARFFSDVNTVAESGPVFPLGCARTLSPDAVGWDSRFTLIDEGGRPREAESGAAEGVDVLVLAATRDADARVARVLVDWDVMSEGRAGTGGMRLDVRGGRTGFAVEGGTFSSHGRLTGGARYGVAGVPLLRATAPVLTLRRCGVFTGGGGGASCTGATSDVIGTESAARASSGELA